MVSPPSKTESILSDTYLARYPEEAALQLEKLSGPEVSKFLATQPIKVSLPLFEKFSTDFLETVLTRLPKELGVRILELVDPLRATEILGRFPEEVRREFLRDLNHSRANEIRRLLDFSEDTAARLMDSKVVPFRKNLTVAQALSKIRDQKPHFTRHLFAVDDQGRLEGLVSLQALALADRRTGLSDLVRPIATFVDLNAPRDEILRKLEDHKITDLPVVDLTGRLVGVIQYDALVETLQEESTIDLQTMMGVSRDERALSRASFAIKNRLPWLHINLLTAFLAAAVVGLFEGTIARFTALAVLLPVVAGQSGNTGSQALAVTLRGLAMREISVSYWVRVLRKEMTVGLVNGFAVAFTTSLGVFLWSRSAALSAVIGSAMVISMVAAVLAGAGIPILLTKMNQDPATSSSIILTTVTDVVGFFTFLGIATLMSGYLG